MLFEIVEIGYNIDNLMFIRGGYGLFIVVFFVTGTRAYLLGRDGYLGGLRVYVQEKM
jgi:hypothetical protein